MRNDENIKVWSAIQQFFTDARDGIQDERYQQPGKAKKIGLMREMGRIQFDSRVIDGVHVRMLGDIMEVVYNSQVLLKDLKDMNYLRNLPLVMDSIETALKKDFKDRTGKALRIQKIGEPFTGDIQYINNQRGQIDVVQRYRILNLG